MVVLVDADVAFRCAFEFDVRRGGGHFVDVEAAGFLDGGLPQPRTEVRSLATSPMTESAPNIFLKAATNALLLWFSRLWKYFMQA